MNGVLVDTSAWIDYFRGREAMSVIDHLLDAGVVCTNELVLVELVPALRHKKEHALVRLVESLHHVALDIDWKELVSFQEQNLRAGINKVGIVDLLIVQNVRHNELQLLSLDKHFALVARHIPFARYEV